MRPITLDYVMNKLVTWLTTCATENGLMPGVLTVKKGLYTLSDAKKPAVCVSWDGERLEGGRGTSLDSENQIAVRLFVDSLPKGDDPDAFARGLYWSTNEAGEQRGLRKAVLAYPGGDGFALMFIGATPILPDAFPKLRFSAGIEVLTLAKMVTGR